jgi:hypothetical protein
MPYVPKTGLQSFDSAWQKATSWATSQGIGMNSILPVYSLDVTRINNGEYQMGAAERNLSILAAANPRNVSSNPSDSPASPYTPSGFFSDAVSDAGKIATGIAGIFTGSFERQIYDSAKATYEGVVHPASLDAPTMGGTISNWLNNTLLSFIPGASDLGTLVKKGPTALLEHPLLSAMDLMGAYEGVGGIVGRLDAEAGERMAAASGGYGLGGVAAKKIGGSTLGGRLGEGVTMGGNYAKNLTVKDALELLMAKAPHGGVGKAIGDLTEATNTSEMMSVDKYQWLMDQPIKEFEDLPQDDKDRLRDILATNRTSGGDSVRQAIDNPDLSTALKQTLSDWINGPERFAIEARLLAGDLRPIYNLNGDVGMWAGAGEKYQKLLGLSKLRQRAERRAVETIAGLAPYAQALKQLDDMRQGSTQMWREKVTTARQTVFNDPKLQGNLTQELPRKIIGRRYRSLSKIEQLHTVVDQNGLVDDFQKVIEEGDIDQIRHVAGTMKKRLSSWGPDSVDAADHPALMELYREADQWERWAKVYQSTEKNIDEAIYGEGGEIARQTHHLEEQKIYRRRGLDQIKARHKEERDNLLQGYQQAKRARMAKLGKLIQNESDRRAWYRDMIRTRGDVLARRATNKVIDTEIMPSVRRQEYEYNQASAAAIKEATRRFKNDEGRAWDKYQLARKQLKEKHAKEWKAASKYVKGELKGMGDALAEVVQLGETIRAYHQAVFDSPADQYKDVLKQLYHNKLIEADRTTALKVAADQYLRDVHGATEARLDELHSNPQVIAELIDMYFKEIMRQPDLDPELAQAATAESAEYIADANQTFKQMYYTKHDDPKDDFRIQYIPTAVTMDESLGRASLRPVITKAPLKPDMVKAKINDLTPNIHDFAVGINKAVVQELHRQGSLHLVEDYLRPKTMTHQEVFTHLLNSGHVKIEDREAFENTPSRLADLALEHLGLKVFDPDKIYRIQLPRWSKAQQLFLPAPMVDALERVEKDHQRSILAKSNKLFRYSILGMSPRYTAHIVFGGTMMLALRSTPYMPLLIGRAWRELRDGVIPREAIRGRESELGFEPVTRLRNTEEKVIDEYHRQGAHDAVNLAVGEHIELKQKIKLAAAKPVHAFKALADINFHITNHVREMQAALAYLDGLEKANRKYGKVTMEDPITGKEITVSSERAMKEAMHHVERVYGNLNRMSPLEKQIAQSFVPFYGWQKHILGYVLSFPFDHPWRAMILSQLAYNSSNDVPAGWPIRIQLLFFLGSPDSQGNVNSIDIRTLDPFRDVANYASWTGLFESLNPALTAIPSIINPQFSYGSSQLYPGVTYNAFYGIETSTAGGSWVNALAQFVPQVGAVEQAAQAAGGYRSEWATDRGAAIKSLLSSLNIPFLNPPINLKQIAAKDEADRFEVAKTAATNAFQTGDFSGLAGYKTVPNPLNDAYEITPKALEELYRQAQQTTPGVAPIESLLPPPTPFGF